MGNGTTFATDNIRIIGNTVTEDRSSGNRTSYGIDLWGGGGTVSNIELINNGLYPVGSGTFISGPLGDSSSGGLIAQRGDRYELTPTLKRSVFNGKYVAYSNAAPASGTWAVGDIVWNTAPTASGNIGWACTTAGTPGTWKTFGSIAA
jgi:hypothetical protein